MIKRKKKQLHILIDLDEVTADLATPWSEWVRQNGDPDFDWHSVKGWNVDQYTSIGKKCYEALEVDGLFLFLEPIPGAIEGVNKLRKMGHKVQFCTSNPTEKSKDEKIEWLKDKFKWFNPETDIIFSHEKDKEVGDVLIDDRAKWINTFPGHTICVDTEYNKHCSGLRATNWGEITNHIDSIAKYG